MPIFVKLFTVALFKEDFRKCCFQTVINIYGMNFCSTERFSHFQDFSFINECSDAVGGQKLNKLRKLLFYRAIHFSAKRGIAIACRLSVCDVGGL